MLARLARGKSQGARHGGLDQAAGRGSEEAVAARVRFVSSFQLSSSIAFVAVSVSTVMSRLVTHLLSSSLFSSSSVFFAISMSAVEPRLTWGGALDAWLAELNEAVGGGAEGPVAAVASLLSSIRFLPSIAFFAIPKSRMVSRLAWGKTLDARADEIGKSPGEGARGAYCRCSAYYDLVANFVLRRRRLHLDVHGGVAVSQRRGAGCEGGDNGLWMWWSPQNRRG